MDSEPKTLTEINSFFADTVKQFIETGIYYSTDGYDPEKLKRVTSLIPHATVRRLMRMVAKDLKRPFIRVTKCYRRDWSHPDRPVLQDGATFLVPRRKYLEPVIAPLFLIAKPDDSRYNRDPNVEVISFQDTVDWGFRFRDIELLDKYIRETLHTNPDTRRAMRLPVE